MNLENILPSPKTPIKAKDIAKFKSDHGKELRQLRNKIESFILSIAEIEDNELRTKSINQFIEGTRDEIAGLTELMKSRDWKHIDPGRFFAYSTAVLGLTSAIVTGGITGCVAAAFGISAAAYKTTKGT